jgi:hypothetical protein
MQSANIPVKITVTWGASAPAGDITYPMPVPSQISITPGRASFTDGFPPDNFLPPGGGGVPPFGQDFNGIVSQITRWTQWQNAGAQILYDPSFSSAVGGYPKWAMLANAATPGLFWVSTVENNTSDPDTGGANWANPGLFAGGTVVGTWPSLTITNSGVTAGTYTNPTITVGADGRVSAVASGTFPTYSTLTSGTSATYTTPAGAKRLKIRMVGGGGAGENPPSTAGGNGGQTSFGSTTANGGAGGASSIPSAGGTGGTTGTGTQIVRFAGGGGGGGWNVNVAAASTQAIIAGAAGGVSPFGGAGANSGYTGNGVAAAANTGSGGSGGPYAANSTGSFTGASGGGAGEYVEFAINNPAATYIYTVGAGGAATGSAGAGAAGVIAIEVCYE